MSGFVGMSNFYRRVNHEKFTTATNLLKRRGPDEFGYHFGSNFSFGHRRQILKEDLFGTQPMVYNDCYIVYNGALTNYQDLKQELSDLGYSFFSSDDAEVVLKSYIAFGNQCLEKLSGMYAFAIYYDQKIFIARDRIGAKPLYYTMVHQDILFASEIKSLLHYQKESVVDLNGLRELLGMGPSHTQGETIYRGIKELRPGHYIEFTKETLSIKRYWNVSPKPFDLSFEETKAKTLELFKKSVLSNLDLKIPMCSFLSGGLDSSAITAIAASAIDNLKTYSLDFENNKKEFKANNFQVSDDQDYIYLVSDAFLTDHENITLQLTDLAESLKEAVIFRDGPGMADIDSSLYLFAKNVSEKYHLGLSGEGADEIFGGYPWFYRKEENSQTFPWLRNLAFRESLLKENWQKKLNLNDYVSQKYQDIIQEVPILEEDTKEIVEHRQMCYLNMQTFMLNLLDRKDRMTMNANLEIRMPFGDHTLIEFLYNVPWEYKFYNQTEKGLLREALVGILPDEVIYRKKSPFPKTHSKKYMKLVAKLFEEAINDESSILNVLFEKSKLIELLEKQEDDFTTPWYGQLMSRAQLFAYLYQLHYWFYAYNIKIVE